MEANTEKISTTVSPHIKKIIDNFQETSGKTQAEIVRLLIVDGIKAVERQYPNGFQVYKKPQRGSK